MSNIGALNTLYGYLTGAEYAAAVAAINASTTTWAGIDITVFAESYKVKVDAVKFKPAVQVVPSTMSPSAHTHSGENEDEHRFTVIVTDMDISAEAAQNKIMAHAWAVRHVVYNGFTSGRHYSGRVENVVFDTPSPQPQGPTVREVAIDVVVVSMDTYQSVDD